MLNGHHKANSINTTTCLASIFSMIIIGATLNMIPGNFSKNAFAQSSAAHVTYKQTTSNEQEKTVMSKPESKQNLNMPGRTIKIDRVGTAFKGRNSVSIKSTDAGIVPRYQPTSGCDNCGIVDFVNITGQWRNNGIITDGVIGGIIGGTIARKIGKNGSHKYSNTGTNTNGDARTERAFEHDTTNNAIHYDVGVTMNDGTQSIITLPNEPRFNNGDRIKLIDGVLVPEH